MKAKIKTVDLKLSRTIDASPAEVFDAWIDPTGPVSPWSGVTKAIVNPPKVDGLFYSMYQLDGDDMAHYGRFVILDRPRKIQYTWVSEATQGLESLVTLTLTPQGDKTVVQVKHTNVPDDKEGRRHTSAWGYVLTRMSAHFRSETAEKKPPTPKSQQESKKVKGSVTRHLEDLHGTTFTEAGLTDGLSEDLRDAWKKLRTFAADLGAQRIYASAQSIMFSRKVCYFYVRPRKNFLEVWIFLPRKIKGLTFMQGPTKKVKYCNLFKVTHADQIEEPLTDWIREAFDFAPDPG